MEQWVRVRNERDRQVLAWMRERVGCIDRRGSAGLHSRQFGTVFIRNLSTTQPVRSEAHEPLREYGCRRGATLGGDLRDLALAFT